MKNNAKNPKTDKKRWLYGLIPLVVILVAAVAVGLYVSSLAQLVTPPEFTGDPSLDESDIFDPNDYPPTVTPAPTSAVTPGAPTETTAPQPSETIDLNEIEDNNNEAISSIKVPQDDQVHNILLIGTDNRGNEINGRSDTMIIMSINKRTQEIHLVSLMRAMYVKIPDRGYSMLNASFSWGGANLLIRTIESNFRIKIDDYILINFSGFAKSIDTIGGVSINLTAAEASYMGGQLTSGTNLLNGTQALAYARIRKLDSDFKRTGRQRTLIEAVIKQARGMSLAELDGMARQILPLVKTNRTGTGLLKLVLDGYAWCNYPVKQLMLPIDGSHHMIIVRKAQMEQYDAKKNIEALHRFLYQ
jgi:LCP family protein required for cell wall assembly